jgi:hypothetical protein
MFTPLAVTGLTLAVTGFGRLGILSLLTTIMLIYNSSAFADSFTGDSQSLHPFHNQFIPKNTRPEGYKPTIHITVSNISETDEREPGWYSDENPNTQFNKLWLDQYKPGYGNIEGSKVLNRMLRFTFKKAYKNYRSENIDMFKQLPNEEGNGKLKNWDSEMEYTVRASDDSIKMGMEYRY